MGNRASVLEIFFEMLLTDCFVGNVGALTLVSGQ